MNTLNAAMPTVAIAGISSGTVPAALMFQSTIDLVSYSSIIAARRSTVLGGGWTLGIAKDVVTPPAAQADVALTMSSLWVKPGLAMVRVDVDRAGQDVQPARVDRPIRRRAASRARRPRRSGRRGWRGPRGPRPSAVTTVPPTIAVSTGPAGAAVRMGPLTRSGPRRPAAGSGRSRRCRRRPRGPGCRRWRGSA